MNSTLQGRVQQVIDDLVDSGNEIGLQVAAYVNGELAVDAWSGVANQATGQPVDGDTLFTSWSTTKGFVATCLHILADRGRVDYDAPIARYWPEFGAHGKEAATVRDALTHRAGVPQMPDDATPEMMTDWEAMCAAIASLAPLWQPGTTVCYHAWTFGWIIGELVRRIDGRPIAQFAREELCQPLGITDFYLGIPEAVESRVAPLVEAPSEPETNPLSLRVMPPHLTSAAVVNRPDFRRASMPESNLRDVPLEGADFSGADLTSCDFSNCNLRGAKLVAADAKGSRWVRADLSDADLRYADLMEAVLQKATLDGADFREASLYAADMARVLVRRPALMDGAHLQKTRVYPKRKHEPR